VRPAAAAADAASHFFNYLCIGPFNCQHKGLPGVVSFEEAFFGGEGRYLVASATAVRLGKNTRLFGFPAFVFFEVASASSPSSGRVETGPLAHIKVDK